MILNRKSVELLAPAGNWDALVAAVEAGADAVYLGGKHFNMRMHRNKETNFDDEMLKKAIEYTHAHGVHLYITLNNLISVEEVEPLKKYLNEIKPDAILVQDFAVLELTKELGIDIPLHTSVMMNTHNEHAIKKLKEYGITRIVVGREMTLSELSLFKERTGLEIEYFMHGDMCIAESGQCIHSGVLFGQSGNRGRCLKPCRWPYKLVEEDTGAVLDKDDQHDYKLALKDMCMYRNIPELIQAGVFSFKIEGRMKTALYVAVVARTYRKAIDDYLKDENLYRQNLPYYREQIAKCTYRQFTTGFFFGKPTHETQIYDSNTYVKEYTYLGIINGQNSQGMYGLEQRNKFSVGETIEVMKPDGRDLPVKVLRICDEEGSDMESCPHPKQKIYVDLGIELSDQDLLRRAEKSDN